MTEPKLLTEAEWRQRISASDYFTDLAIAALDNAGLIAPEPVDPLLYIARAVVIQDGTTRTVNQIEAIRDGKAGHEKVAYALAGLRKGREMFGCGCARLTPEMVGGAVVRATDECDNSRWHNDFVTRLHAALTERQP